MGSWIQQYNYFSDALERQTDFGCGTGKFSRFLRDKDAEVVGVDLSKKMLEAARKIDPEGIEYHEINTSGKMSFVQGSFDAVVVNFVRIPQRLA